MIVAYRELFLAVISTRLGRGGGELFAGLGVQVDGDGRFVLGVSLYSRLRLADLQAAVQSLVMVERLGLPQRINCLRS